MKKVAAITMLAMKESTGRMVSSLSAFSTSHAALASCRVLLIFPMAVPPSGMLGDIVPRPALPAGDSHRSPWLRR